MLVDIATPNALAGQQVVRCDFARDALPFADNSFDFVYCRHVLEDLFDPFRLCAEMARVGRAGYIETPSPMAEMCRGVDGASPPWRGYYHHHFVVWPHEGELRFVMKYPLVEYLDFTAIDLASGLRRAPHHWNTHFLWDGAIKTSHRQSLVDFHLFNDYGHVLGAAIVQGRTACDAFWHEIPRETRVAQIGLNRSSAA